MLRSIYRTLFTYTIFKQYFDVIFTFLIAVLSITEISFFYSDFLEISRLEEKPIYILVLFVMKWVLIFGFSIYFLYSLYKFQKPKKEAKKEEKTIKNAVLKEKNAIKKEKTPYITQETQQKLDNILYKKKLRRKDTK